MFLFFICTDRISSFIAHGIALECGASHIRHKSTSDEAQSMSGELYSTVTLHSDQPTHGIAPECGIHLLGIQNSQSKSLWHLTKKGNKSKFNYVFEIRKNDKPIRIYFFKDVSIFICTDRISSFCSHGIAPECGVQVSGTKVPQMKHNLLQEKFYSTVTLQSDQPTHKIALE